MRHPVFGQRVRNLWASERNPHREGIFVEVIRRTGKVINKGTFYRLTDGRGEFWEIGIDNIEIIPLESLQEHS